MAEVFGDTPIELQKEKSVTLEVIRSRSRLPSRAPAAPKLIEKPSEEFIENA
jgi:hypothetical protein